MKLAINGAMGRMGKMVLEAAWSADGIDEVSLVESTENASSGERMETKWGELPLLPGIEALPEDIDAGIDYSVPGAAVDFIEALASRGRPVVSGTTGLSVEQRSRVVESAGQAAVLLASNTSLGVFCLHEVSEAAKGILGSGYDVEIVEIHHRHKRDAPSGTAKSLAELLAGDADDIVAGRDGDIGPRPDNELGVLSVRGGEVIGEHTVYFLGDDDRIEITHRASSRRIFARGGVALLLRLMGKQPGLYSVKDLLDA